MTAFPSRWSVLFGAALVVLAGFPLPAPAAYQLPPASGVRTSFADDDDFLDYVQRKTFNFFWDTQNPVTGLMLDRASNPGLCSIASVGFGLSSINVAIDRGWITRAQGRARVRTALQFLWNLPQGVGTTGIAGYHGWFYHFLDTTTGLRVGNCELSTIDTTLLMLGVLDCGLYFDDPADADEAAIRQLSANLIDRIDWAFVTRSDNRIAMAWDPVAGFEYGGWSGYSEAMALYLLGLGAGTNPLPASSWAAWTSTYLWKTHFGYSYVWTPTGSLFTHCYSHCWVDFRGINDPFLRANGGGIDYFENSRRATLAQQAYAAAQPFPNYGPLEFGVTACDGPNATVGGVYYAGYTGRGAPPGPPTTIDDGTLAPTGALGTLPFAPEACLPAARHLYDTYLPKIWSDFGFCDAFNIQAGGWFDPDVVGIDAGPIILMIENHRSGSIWRRLLRSPTIQRGLERAGFTAPPPEAPVATAVSGTQLDVTWDDSSGFETGFQVEISTDNANFTIAATVAAGTTHASLTVLPGTTYYVRVRTTSTAGLSGSRGLAVATTPVPVVPGSNAISYDATTFPAVAAAGASVGFTCDVTNTGTNPWGPNHYLVLREANLVLADPNDPNGNLAFTSLNGVPPGAGATAALSFMAPATPGNYTYFVQGLENNVAWFSSRATVNLLVNVPTTADFNGDGRADIFWSNTSSGDRYLWLMSSGSVTASIFVGTIPTPWMATAGDFNGDGEADLLWSNTANGDRYIWLMNGGSVAASIFVGTVPAQWTPVAGDFNGDGRTDLLWSNVTTGDRYVWLMNGGSVSASVFLGTVPTQWAPMTGDFNGDGKTDLLWSNVGSGDRYIWLMNGGSVTASIFLGNIPTQWTPMAGDFNGDGKTDLLWSNVGSGDRYIWLMDGGSVTASVFLGTVAPQWIPAIGDFNGDGKADLLWSNLGSGDRYLWLMNSGSVTNGIFLGTIAPQWQVGD